MRTFTIGDIHGNFKALKQCLARASFEKTRDRLIVLGDVCDGYPEVKECITELLTIKNLVYIIGNHDYWALSFFKDPYKPQEDIWLSQGGLSTKKSYRTHSVELEGYDRYAIPKEHIDLLHNAHIYLEEDNKVFVHGGFEPTKDISKQDFDDLMWDRELFYNAWNKHYHGKPNYKYGGFDEIYIGHTTTQCKKTTKPIHVCNLWNLDTGAGWGGKLTIMNIDTKEYFQSDSADKLYPKGNGRNERY